MIRSVSICAALAAVTLTPGFAQRYTSPAAQTSVTIAGKSLTIKYSAPSVHGRKIFGPGGLISHDPTYPVWRAGANAATAFHTDANLDMQGLHVPAGNYTLFVDVSDPDAWQLIVSKQTGEWGLAYNKSMDLGRVKMDMSKPSAPVETFKITLSSTGGNSGKLEMAWENHIASVPFTAQ
jgi:hypothetical protein